MTDILLGEREVFDILHRTGALRDGHFALPTGYHTSHYIQMPLAMRYYSVARVLCVGLSRLFRGCRPVTTALPHCSVIAPPSGGIPVAFGVGEALQVEQIIWAEHNDGGYQFRQYMEVRPGNKCILVDDILRSGSTLRAMAELIRGSGGEVIAAGVLVDHRRDVFDLGEVPFYSLVRTESAHYKPEDCPLCRAKMPLDEIRYEIGE